MTIKTDKPKASVTDETRRRAAQFIRFMQVVIVACLSLVIFDVVMVLVGSKVQLYGLIILTSGLAAFAFAAILLVRSGRLTAGVYLWSTGMSVDVALYPLVATDMLPAVVMTAVVNVLLVAMFLSPRQIRWATPIVLGFVGLSTWMDGLPTPWQRIDTMAQIAMLPFVVNVAGVGFVAMLINMLGSNLLGALESSQANAAQLEESRTTLFQQTQDLRATTAELVTRTGELERLNLEFRTASQQAHRRAEMLSTSALVARTVSELINVEELLPRVVLLIGQAFGYYHVGIFLVDELKRFAVLHTVNSEAGEKMLARGYKVMVGPDNLVGAAVSTGEPQIARDSGQGTVRPGTPDLPQTRSEIALPLQTGGQVFGVLDAHSTEESAFSEEDLAILGTLADQIAIAVENARLLAQTQAALQESQKIQERYLRREWEQLLPTLRTVSHEYHMSGAPAVGDARLPEIEQALQQGDAVVVTPDSNDGSGYTGALAVPIKLRDQIIGVIDLHEIDRPREWTEEDVALVIEVADQAAQALETTRLFEQTQQQARREQLTSSIAARLRAAPDVESVLKATVHEIRRALGVSHGVIRLKTGREGAQTLTDTTA